MGSLGPTTVSGEGHAVLSGGTAVAVTDVHYSILAVSGKVRLVGTMTPRGIWRAGQVGLGWFIGDGSGTTESLSIWDKFIHLENEDVNLPALQFGSWFASSVWWRLELGMSVALTVSW